MRWLTLIFVLLCGPLTAQDTPLVSLQTGVNSRGWEGVGRLDIIDQGFCTAALIDEVTILTAAHCIYRADGSLIPADRFVFEAGLRNGRAEASRNISAAYVHPDYQHVGQETNVSHVATDVAILTLARPIRHPWVKPFPIASAPRSGDEIGIVSYARERAEAPSLQEVCTVLNWQNGVMIMTCSIDFGASGSPVFVVQNGVAKIASVVSAKATSNGRDISLGTSLVKPLATLRQIASTPKIGKRIGLQSGERRDTGAKFVRP